MGILRTWLALIVVAAHAEGTLPGSFLNGFQAVAVFFIISGFYMALILNERYVKPDDTVLFYTNRALRILPLYWISLFWALAVSTLTQADVDAVYASLTWLGKLYYVTSNALAVGLEIPYFICVPTLTGDCVSPGYAFSINPPAWSISIELMFYAAAPFIVRSARRTVLFALLGAGYLLVLDFFKLDANTDLFLRFYALPSSFLLFGAGALGYHLLFRPMHAGDYLLCLGLGATLFMTQTVLPGEWVLGIALALPPLFLISKKINFDGWIGELSYPVYILHFPCLVLARYVGLAGPSLMWVAIATSLIAAALCNLTINRTIENARRNVRNRTSLPHQRFLSRFSAAA